jgi:hypothetical protein
MLNSYLIQEADVGASVLWRRLFQTQTTGKTVSCQGQTLETHIFEVSDHRFWAGDFQQ